MTAWTVPTGWTLSQNYPQYNVDAAGLVKMATKYFAQDTAANIIAALPSTGDTFEGYLFDGAKLDAGETGDFFDIELSFADPERAESEQEEPTPAGGGTEKADGEYYWTCTGSQYEIPIERHPNYRPCWNNFLYVRNGCEPTAVWAGSTPSPISYFNGLKNEKFFRSPSDAPDGWEQKEGPLYPWLESYIVPLIQVSGCRKWKHFSSLTAANPAAHVGKLKAPDETFGLPDNSSNPHWIQIGAVVKFDGKRWVSEETYLYFESIQPEELYT